MYELQPPKLRKDFLINIFLLILNKWNSRTPGLPETKQYKFAILCKICYNINIIYL